MQNSIVRVFLESGLVAVGQGEVILQPDEGALYVIGDDGAHTVFNFRHVTHYTITPNEEKNEEPSIG
ncbi:hypothetical protein SEA_PANAMAXUS_45 [Mycobacterium phage Panamaxus]|uniref:Uncharacterized protein n=1 Tax=Mycobacterium phage Veracruz TaxID=2530154 RepID=A0A481VTL3_9CAUD|nr:hypothetical protein KIP27_gp46 [Mycobacterium phage Veracruz]AIS73720.1 hypothetical protein PBI_QUINNKIRO_46 [Mycobacterium phage QuinnKiro]ALA11849.1 hypothetical protein SEA_TEXAGE_46 [Mycobacterium phage Texage]AOT24196.1 hypothetical protein SEA_TODACORO_47 [Mycobacterium phage Todacoro]AOT25549.1 hypothetical protein SEA_MARGO_47 [Mycobacterium phage Margo]AUX82343.1 hypothetical protein SEA_LAMBERT1_47 [Mycobacterium phage Lambert1]AVP42964.1 hypothetical protein SEA_PANAMAXUS_45 [